MSNATLMQWLERLNTVHPKEMELGLERVSLVARRLNLIPVSVPVITVAGTNGKGSTCAVMEAVLVQTKRVVGVCSSPHFLRFNERIRVGGAEVEDQAIVEAFEAIDVARAEVSLTYFEFAALAALLLFRQLEVELMILEVGLGGRLDAINIVDASVAVITAIALDHQEWLGDTRDLIAVEKAGIFRPGQSAVVADPDPPPSLVREARAREVNALYLGQEFYVEECAGGWRGTVLNNDGSTRTLPKMAAGSLLPANVCAGLQALLLAGEVYSDRQLISALAQLRLPGRRETREQAGCSYLLDVAHNPEAVDKLLEYIDLNPCNGRTIALFSVMADKDVEGMIVACAERFDAWYVPEQLHNSRAVEAARLAAMLCNKGETVVAVSDSIGQAFRHAQSDMARGDRLVIFGSFFTVAGVIPLLESDLSKGEQ